MIRYALMCGKGHEFEAWFRNSAAFDEQSAAAHIHCPACGSADVTKALMAPSVVTRKGRSGADETDVDVPSIARQIREQVFTNADYVGDRFPEEARKIHYEETEPRGIYGEATPQEAKELNDEGVVVYPLPPAPEEHN